MSQDWVQRLAYSGGFLGSAGGCSPRVVSLHLGLSERGPPGTVSWEVLTSRGGGCRVREPG